MATPSSIAGAWELTGRYSELNTQDSIVGNKVNTSTLGLNYYYDKNVRLTGNMLYSESSQQINGSRSGNAISFRAQYQF